MIAIPNMSKPKECKECQWHLDFYIEDKQVGGLCTITEKDDKENTCPLIEIDLVRCGECKFCDDKGKGRALICTNPYIDMDIHPLDFCSYGERRANDKEIL